MLVEKRASQTDVICYSGKKAAILSHVGRKSQQTPLNWQFTCHDISKGGKRLGTEDEDKTIEMVV